MADEKYMPLTCGGCRGVLKIRLRQDGSPHKTQPSVCSTRCRTARRYGSPVEYDLDPRSCAVCLATYLPKHRVSVYCSKVCKVTACRRKSDPLFGLRRDLNRTQAIAKRAKRAQERIERERSAQEAKKAAHWQLLLAPCLVPRACRLCGVAFSRLPGTPRSLFCSDECRVESKREQLRTERAMRKPKERARLRAATVERVSPAKVFARDGWHCYLCGCDTPKALRGSYEMNAPELEHVVPLSRGGAHSYANTRCSCRACNLAKGDRTADEVGGSHASAGGRFHEKDRATA